MVCPPSSLTGQLSYAVFLLLQSENLLEQKRAEEMVNLSTQLELEANFQKHMTNYKSLLLNYELVQDR